MKKYLLILAVLVVSVVPASAATLKVRALSDFNTENPPETIEVKAVSDLDINEELLILDGYILKGNLVDVVSPKRLKRDATFSLVLTEYTDNDGRVHVLGSKEKQFKGKFTTAFNYKHAAKSAALSVGNFFVKGLSLGYAAVEGAVKNEEGNRVKSSAVSVFESTPLSYVEKGQDIVILKNQIFCLKFKSNDSDEDVLEETAENEVSSESTLNTESYKENIVPSGSSEVEEKSESAEKQIASQSEQEEVFKAPLPDEEYMTVETLQAEVLATPSENDVIAFGFKRSSDADKASETETLETVKPALLKNTEDAANQTVNEFEEKVREVSDDAIRPVQTIEADVSEKVDEAEIRENIPDMKEQIEEQVESQPKVLKELKNEVRSESSERMEKPVRSLKSKLKKKSDIQAEEEILPESSDPAKGFPAASEFVENQNPENQINRAPEASSKSAEVVDSAKSPNLEQTEASVQQPVEAGNSGGVMAEKHLNRHSFDNIDSLVPRLPAVSSEPLAPLDLPDTY